MEQPRIDIDIDDIVIIAEKTEPAFFDFTCNPRHHDGFVYFIQGEGSLDILTDNTSLPVHDGTLFWFRQGDSYRFRVNAGCRYITSAYRLTRDTIGVAASPTPFVSHVSAKTALAITQLSREWERHHAFSYLRCRLGILSLYTNLLAETHRPQTDPTICIAVEFIHKNFRRPFSGAELANACALSLSHLRQKFRSEIGMTVTEYRDSLRMDSAREMLSSGLFTPKETAFELGYSDVYHFTKAFTAHVGIPPARFAKNT